MGVISRAKEHPVISICIFVDVILIAAIILGVYRNVGRTVLIDIEVVPSTAKVKIAGRTYSNGAYYIKPGKAKATISAKGFKTKTIEIKSEDSQNIQLSAILKHKKEGYSYYIDNLEDIENFYAILETEAERDESIERFKILKDLPFLSGGTSKDSNVGYTITKDENEACDEAPCLQILGQQKDAKSLRKEAENLLTDNGYSIDEYTIIYHGTSGDIEL